MNQTFFGDCRDSMRKLIADGVKVQTCVTSPPYWGLRDYGTASWDGGDPDCQHSVGGQVQDSMAPGAIVSGQRPGVDSSQCRKCEATRIDKQLGLEPTIKKYVANMVEVFRLVRDLLADDGTLWLNLGDSYNAYNGNAGPSSGFSAGSAADTERPKLQSGHGLRTKGLKPKDLCGIPWRVAFALQSDGWWLRQDIIWSKPNPMPESVRDRCTKAHEYLFMLTKKERYYYDQDAIKEPMSMSSVARLEQPNLEQQAGSDRVPGKTNGAMKAVGKVDKQRGHGRIHAGFNDRWDATEKEDQCSGMRNKRSVWTVATQPYSEAHFATFPSALIEPCVLAGSRVGDVVFDPFMGSGTTAMVAQNLGRQYLGCELNPDYEPMQKTRTSQGSLVL